ncbi:TIGR03089 family protein [Cellulomonas sp. Leaf395]|uniref:TIGR03089 family protein n=1 Tax=Cellulomonas sp. Leaf395 TaxID=1736362 RepID=UPI0006FCD02F|nr:TIGR03089 family protein [Cellulomonas sp. Leaf395]KQS99785.1 hypothetical protein ASG23_10685 [Cellulomonas sp. Leaf395]
MPVTTIADLLRLLTREPGRPRITWYGDGGERVELSGAVLENWVNKTANLLVEEFDAGPATRVHLDLPGHWRTVVWAVATWRVGACVVLGEASPVDVVVTDRPAQHVGARDTVAVSLPALARTYAGELPAGTLDAATAVMTYGDGFGWAPPLDPLAIALDDDGQLVAHAALLATLARSGCPERDRVLLGVDARGLADLLGDVLTVLVHDGSAVVVSGESSRLLRTDQPRRERMVSSERITADTLDVVGGPPSFR